MGWIDPRYAEHQRRRWLRPDWQRWVRHDAHRFLPPGQREAKARVVAAETDEAALAAEREALRVDLQRLSREVKDLQAYLALRRLNFKINPNVELQPRDKDGKWTIGGRTGGTSIGDPQEPQTVVQPAFLAPPAAPPLTVPMPVLPGIGVPDPAMKPGDRAAIERQLSLYNLMSRLNTPDSRAVFGFNSRAFVPNANPELAAADAGVLTREEVEKICPKYTEVQGITNEAVRLHSPGAYSTPQVYGTAVHTWIKEEINGPTTVPPTPPRDPNFRSEASFIKSQEVKYGDPGSKRVDVFENTRKNDTVCVYDIKTGTSGLSFARMRELATNVGKFYGAKWIIVTEVRGE